LTLEKFYGSPCIRICTNPGEDNLKKVFFLSLERYAEFLLTIDRKFLLGKTGAKWKLKIKALSSAYQPWSGSIQTTQNLVLFM
jgi:hypothetical protein